jgi:hypothetical protein
MDRRTFLRLTALAAVAAGCDMTAARRLLLAAGGSGAIPPPWWFGADLWVYGHSYTADPGIRCTAGSEFFNVLAARYAMTDTTYGVSSSRLQQVFFDVLGATTGSVGGSTWDASRTGAVVVDCEVNDAYNFNGVGTAQSLTAQGVSNYGDALRGILAVLSASSRVEQTAGTTSGVWSTNTDGRFSGGSNIETTALNAYIDLPVTVGSSGVVWLISYLLSSSLGSGLVGEHSIYVDGVLHTTVPAVTSAFDQIKSGRGPETLDFGVKPIRLAGISPGARTIRVKKTDAGAGKVYVDCILVQGDDPVKVVIVKDPDPNTAASASAPTSASDPDSNRVIILANKPLLDDEIDGVLGDFSNAVAVESGISVAGVSAVDALHPNDTGMAQLAASIAGGLAAAA